MMKTTFHYKNSGSLKLVAFFLRQHFRVIPVINCLFSNLHFDDFQGDEVNQHLYGQLT